MTLSRAELLTFIRQHRYAVESTIGHSGGPQAALVGFVVNDTLEFFFDAFGSTRKVANLRADPRIALVIGGTTAGDERTVQVEGIVDEPTGEALEAFQKRYFAELPDGKRRAKLPGIQYFRVRPRWIRYSDLNVNPPRIEELSGDALR
jgi:hypothetical protein